MKTSLVLLIGLATILCFSASVLAVGNYTNPGWRELSTQFGIAKPFRFGHSAGITTFGRLVSFSGLDNVLTGSTVVSRYNYLSNSQLQVLVDNPNNERPSRQLSAFGLWDDRYLAIYGGNQGGSVSNELLIHDILSSSWVANITTSLYQPTFNDQNHYDFSTEGPVGAIDNGEDAMFVFGGRSVIVQVNYVTKIYLDTGLFVQINFTNTNPATLPSGRWGAAMAFYNSTATNKFLFVFGGRQGLGNPIQDPDCFNDLFRLTLSASDTTPSTWAPVSASGSAPDCRAHMATTVLDNGRDWIIFGGANELDENNPVVYNDVFQFNMADEAWTELATIGTAPTPRFKLPAMHLGWEGEDSILYYGGSGEDGGALNQFWKLEFASNDTSPIPAPTQDGSNSEPPPVDRSSSSSSSVSSSSFNPDDFTSIEPSVAEDAASAISSWLSLFM